MLLLLLLFLCISGFPPSLPPPFFVFNSACPGTPLVITYKLWDLRKEKEKRRGKKSNSESFSTQASNLRFLWFVCLFVFLFIHCLHLDLPLPTYTHLLCVISAEWQWCLLFSCWVGSNFSSVLRRFAAPAFGLCGYNGKKGKARRQQKVKKKVART